MITNLRSDDAFLRAAWEKTSQSFENAQLTLASDISPNSPDTYPVDELEQHTNLGIPIALQRIGGRLYATFTPDTHALVIGATRSGKTTGFIRPMVQLCARRGDRPSLLISDPKGEIYSASAATLRRRGYRVILYNFRDTSHSACWNPLMPLYQMQNELVHLIDEVVTQPVKGSVQYVFRGEIYKTKYYLNNKLEAVKNDLQARIESFVDELCYQLIEHQESKEPQWDFGAIEIIKGTLLGLLEDTTLTKEASKRLSRPIVSEAQFTLRSLFAILDRLCIGAYDDFILKRPADSPSRRYAESYVTMEAKTTKAGYFAVVKANLSRVSSHALLNLTGANTVDFSTLDDKPTAIFILYRDEERSHYKFVSILIQQLYNTLIGIANNRRGGTYETDGRLARPFYFIWDEFGNFPKLDDIGSKITACGSRNIWLMLVIQSYSQLNVLYDAEQETIIGNANLQIYFGSNDFDTKRRISDQCLKHAIITPLSAMQGTGERLSSYDVREVPLLPISRLSRMSLGDAVITRLNMYPMLSHYERDYQCAEFTEEPSDPTAYTGDQRYLLSKNVYPFLDNGQFGLNRF